MSENDFTFKDGNTELKLNVIIQTLKIASSAKMIGEFNDKNHINLKTEKLAGNINSCLGLIKVEGLYVPNTVLAADIRKETDRVQKILAVLSKNITEKQYNKIESVGKKIDINRLLAKISLSVEIEPEIIPAEKDEKKL